VFSLITGGPEKARKKQEEGKNRLDDNIRTQFEKEGIMISQEYRDVNYSVIGLDEENFKICFLNSNAKVNPDLYEFLHDNITDNIQYSTSTFDYKDILETEVIIDGETVTKTSRSSQVGGAILGGILAGGVGAIIGGLSGKSSSKEKVKTIQFKIIVNDIKEPLQIITFFNESKSIDRNNEKFIKANKEIMHWHSLFKIIIDIADKEESNSIQPT